MNHKTERDKIRLMLLFILASKLFTLSFKYKKNYLKFDTSASVREANMKI